MRATPVAGSGATLRRGSGAMLGLGSGAMLGLGSGATLRRGSGAMLGLGSGAMLRPFRPSPSVAIVFAWSAFLLPGAGCSSGDPERSEEAPRYAPVAASFYEAWSDGRGEVNSYEIVEERYGPPRDGHAVLVFVAEELDRNTYVKVESERTPAEDRMYVIKLNHLRSFPTGIYDYSAMTTVFSVAGSHLGHHPFQAARVVHSTQEWCGQVYHRVDLRKQGWEEELRSYFESEGDSDRLLPSIGTDLEDNLWVFIRELGGPVIAPGETMTLDLYPSLWELRKVHKKFVSAPVTVSKGAARDYEALGRQIPAHPWSWTVQGRALTVYVEAEGHRRILGWEDSRGGRGRLVASERLPYWRLNGTRDAAVRNRFALPGSELVARNP